MTVHHWNGTTEHWMSQMLLQYIIRQLLHLTLPSKTSTISPHLPVADSRIADSVCSCPNFPTASRSYSATGCVVSSAMVDNWLPMWHHQSHSQQNVWYLHFLLFFSLCLSSFLLFQDTSHLLSRITGGPFRMAQINQSMSLLIILKSCRYKVTRADMSVGKSVRIWNFAHVLKELVILVMCYLLNLLLGFILQ